MSRLIPKKLKGNPIWALPAYTFTQKKKKHIPLPGEPGYMGEIKEWTPSKLDLFIDKFKDKHREGLALTKGLWNTIGKSAMFAGLGKLAFTKPIEASTTFIGGYGGGKVGEKIGEATGTDYGSEIGNFIGSVVGGGIGYKSPFWVDYGLAKTGNKGAIGRTVGRSLEKQINSTKQLNLENSSNPNHNLFRAVVYKGGDITDPYFSFFTTDPKYARLYGKVKKYLFEAKEPTVAQEPLMGYRDPVTSDMFVYKNTNGNPNSKVIIGKDMITEDKPYHSQGTEIISLGKDNFISEIPLEKPVSIEYFLQNSKIPKSNLTEGERQGIPKADRYVYDSNAFENAKQFAKKYGYEEPKTIEETKNMYRQHNSFFRTVFTLPFELDINSYPELHDLTHEEMIKTLGSKGYPLYWRDHRPLNIGKGFADEFVFVSPSLLSNSVYNHGDLSTTVKLQRPFSLRNPDTWHIDADWRPNEERSMLSKFNKGETQQGNSSLLQHELKVGTKSLIPVKIAESTDKGTLLPYYLDKYRVDKFGYIIPWKEIKKQGGRLIPKAQLGLKEQRIQANEHELDLSKAYELRGQYLKALVHKFKGTVGLGGQPENDYIYKTGIAPTPATPEVEAAKKTEALVTATKKVGTSARITNDLENASKMESEIANPLLKLNLRFKTMGQHPRVMKAREIPDFDKYYTKEVLKGHKHPELQSQITRDIENKVIKTETSGLK